MTQTPPAPRTTISRSSAFIAFGITIGSFILFSLVFALGVIWSNQGLGNQVSGALVLMFVMVLPLVSIAVPIIIGNHIREAKNIRRHYQLIESQNAALPEANRVTLVPPYADIVKNNRSLAWTGIVISISIIVVMTILEKLFAAVLQEDVSSYILLGWGVIGIPIASLVIGGIVLLRLK